MSHKSSDYSIIKVVTTGHKLDIVLKQSLEKKNLKKRGKKNEKYPIFDPLFWTYMDCFKEIAYIQYTVAKL